MTVHDVIVVGARCAGAPTAMLLARRGHRVLLVDRATFPSDTMSTHLIKPAGVAHLKRWRLLGTVAGSGCPPITRFSSDAGDFRLAGSPTPLDGVAEAYAPRRTVLDKILVDAAAEAGAEVREGFAVDDLLANGDRVVGIRGRGRGGPIVAERARIVVGADGRRSFVARAVGAPAYDARPPLTTTYYTYWADVPTDGLESYSRDRRFSIAFPTHKGLTCTFHQWPRQEFHTVRADVEGSVLRALEALAPDLAGRVRGGRRAERFVGTADLPSFFRRPHGPGWALVGDAGYHRDPLTAWGITDAFRDAELVAEAIDDGLSERRPMGEALAEYERQRNEAARPAYEATCRRAAFEPLSADEFRLRAALRDDPAETSRYLGAAFGTVPIREFFAPENVKRIIAAVPRTRTDDPRDTHFPCSVAAGRPGPAARQHQGET